MNKNVVFVLVLSFCFFLDFLGENFFVFVVLVKEIFLLFLGINRGFFIYVSRFSDYLKVLIFFIVFLILVLFFWGFFVVLVGRVVFFIFDIFLKVLRCAFYVRGV